MRNVNYLGIYRILNRKKGVKPCTVHISTFYLYYIQGINYRVVVAVPHQLLSPNPPGSGIVRATSHGLEPAVGGFRLRHSPRGFPRSLTPHGFWAGCPLKARWIYRSSHSLDLIQKSKRGVVGILNTYIFSHQNLAPRAIFIIAEPC